MISDTDREAFKLAIAMFRARNHNDARYVNEKIEREGFQAAGRYAAYSAQMDTLHLPPWAFPPCWIADDDIDHLIAAGDDAHGKFMAAMLLLRMRELGISKYHPDPLRAVEAAKKDAAA